MRQALIVLGVAALALAGVACDDGPNQSATDFNSPPYTRGIEVARTYNYSLMTHCGIEHTQIDGTEWKASPPLGDGNGNPPKEWPNGPVIGHLKIVSRYQAVFTYGDLSATFVRAHLPPAGCA
jgi:hypothetical protein